MRAVMEAVPRALADPDRPVYHFAAPARWMNDINGPIYYRGHYHIFYQHNPFGDKSFNENITDHIQLAQMHWGHARSKGLVSWEHLPIALAPCIEQREMSCWSGCATLNVEGAPMLFYTAVFENEMPYKIPFEQWAAVGSEDLLTWERSAANPILSLESHGKPDFNSDWRDPFIFRAADRTFMIIGACGEAGTPIYEARNNEFTKWEFQGIMWDRSVECPNFVPLDDKWLFISSPFEQVSYNVGTFDTKSLRFIPETTGIVDQGHYYGTNTLFDDQGRCILFGWIPGWEWDVLRNDCGWNGCMSLPRILSLGANGCLLQSPAPELHKLRKTETHFHRSDMAIDSSHVLEGVQGDTLEIIIEFLPGDATAYGLNVRRSEDGKNAVRIKCEREKHMLDIAGSSVPLSPADMERPLKLHLFLDKSVIEAYVNDGEAVATRMLYPGREDLGVEIFAGSGSMTVRSIDIWEMMPAVITSKYLDT